MRGREHLADIGAIDTDSHKAGLVDGHAAVARDLWDVDRCDVLLMNLAGAYNVSIGSMVELGRASSKGKFVIVVLPSDELGEKAGLDRNPHDHLFVYELASVVVDTVDEALQVLSAL
jgi:nucleoside 2-deoxyribosyltransferase